MITAISVTVSILGLFLLTILILSISIDFRTVIDIDKNDFMVEAKLFKRFRILRLSVSSVNGAFYIKPLKKPYLSVGYLADKLEKREQNEGDDRPGFKLDMSAVYDALKRSKLHLMQLRVYVNVGGDDSLATSMIWGGAETVAGIAAALASEIIESDNVSILVRPEFKYASFQADAAIKARLGSLLKAGFAVLKGLKRGEEKAAA